MEPQKFSPKVVYLDPAELTPYSRNTKKHPEDQINKIAAQIASAGFDVPIVVDAEHVIIKGHGRREAAIKLGLKQVPVIVRDDLSELQVQAARIADNKVAESAWDLDMLAFELGTLERGDFDLNLTGFDESEWSALLKDDSFDFSLTDSPEASNEDAEEPEEQDAPTAEETKHVKMIQLFLNEETAEEFTRWCKELEKVLETDNLTDTVYEAVRAYHQDKLQAAE